MRLLGVLSLILLTACSDPINVGDESSILSQSEMQRQKIAWEIARGGQAYIMRVYRDCNCIKPADFFYNYEVFTNPITNTNIDINSIDDEGNRLQGLPDNPLYYPNMETLFDQLIEAMANGAVVYGRFDSDYGYPISLEVDGVETYTITVPAFAVE